MSQKKRSVLLLVLALAGLWAFTVTDASAANQVVSDCGDNGGANQLRAKINAANSTGGGTITFTCGPFIHLQSGMLPNISTNITLDGNGITISGNNASRIFLVTYDATLTKTGTLTLNNVTLTKGYSGGEDGGAIWNGAGTVNLNNSKILDNQAGGSGGAIVSYGPLNITNSEFANNKGASGGALYLRIGSNPVTIKGSHFHDNQTTGTGAGHGGAMLLESGAVVTIENSTLNNNQATSSLLGGGGAINLPASSTLTMKNTTLNGNWASRVGGGIYNERGTVNLTNVTLSGNSATYGGGINNYSGTATLINSTVSGNSALQNGGGIFNDRGILHLTNVTLSGNFGNYSGGGILTYASEMNLNNVTFHGNGAPNGSAIFRTTGTGTANIKNTLIGNSTAGSNCDGITGGSFNLSDDGSCGFGAGRDNVPNLNLVPLANNGGSTKTHLPGAGSAAIDQAQCTDVQGNPVPKDQRGVSRPQGLTCDVGAVEVQPAAPTATRTKTATPTRTKTATRTATKPAPTATRTPTTGCQTKPAKPILKKPANDDTLSTTRPKLKWSTATCAETYKVVIKNAGTGAKVHKKAGLIALKYKTDPLPTNVRLKWFVQACKATFGCAKSAPSYFTLQ